MSLARPSIHRFLALTTVAVAAQLLLWFPWEPQILKPGLDRSYYYALNELFVRGAQFAGSVHPHGPYGFLKNDVYHPATFGLLAASRVALFAVFALLAARAATRWTVGFRRGALWITLLVAVTSFGEAYFASLAVLAFLAFWSADDPADRARWSPTVLALSLTSLMKFNFGLMVVSVLGLMALAAVLEQLAGRPRWRTANRPAAIAASVAWPALYLAGLLVLWMSAGQEVARLGEYVTSRFRFSAGYTESHALAGPAYQIVVFAAAGAALWVVFTARELRRSGIGAIAPSLALGLWVALAAKHSFLRQDADHAAHGAFQGLCAAAIFGFLMLRVNEPGSRPGRRAPALAALAAMVAASLSLISFDRAHGYGAVYFRHLDVAARARMAVRFVRDPSHIRERHGRALARIRRADPLPVLDGPVDVYPWELSLAFAHGLEWDPRPSVGSHMADRPEVAFANAAHLAAPDGPAHVLFKVDSLDARFPAMDDGPSWPILLSGFELRSAAGSHLVLDRAQRRRAVEWGQPIARELAFGQRLEVAQTGDRLLWLRADLIRTRRGGLLAAAWRGPIVYLSVELGAGGERWYRLVPGAARAGFLLSPVVVDNPGFVALLDGSWPQLLAADRVRALTLHTEFGDGWYWEPRAQVELRELTIR